MSKSLEQKIQLLESNELFQKQWESIQEVPFGKNSAFEDGPDDLPPRDLDTLKQACLQYAHRFKDWSYIQSWFPGLYWYKLFENNPPQLWGLTELFSQAASEWLDLDAADLPKLFGMSPEKFEIPLDGLEISRVVNELSSAKSWTPAAYKFSKHEKGFIEEVSRLQKQQLSSLEATKRRGKSLQQRVNFLTEAKPFNIQDVLNDGEWTSPEFKKDFTLRLRTARPVVMRVNGIVPEFKNLGYFGVILTLVDEGDRNWDMESLIDHEIHGARHNFEELHPHISNEDHCVGSLTLELGEARKRVDVRSYLHVVYESLLGYGSSNAYQSIYALGQRMSSATLFSKRKLTKFKIVKN